MSEQLYSLMCNIRAAFGSREGCSSKKLLWKTRKNSRSESCSLTFCVWRALWKRCRNAARLKRYMLLILDRSVMTKYILLALSARGRYAFRSYRDKPKVKGKQTGCRRKGTQEGADRNMGWTKCWNAKVYWKYRQHWYVCGVWVKRKKEQRKIKPIDKKNTVAMLHPSGRLQHCYLLI